MVNYQNGKIYKIVSNTDDDICYVGSTTKKYLSQRMDCHRNDYKCWKNQTQNSSYTSSYDIFEKYGVENCRIELLELVSCNSKDELTKKEGEYIKTLNCVNKCIAGRTKKEYRAIYNVENKDIISEKQKIYNEKNKDHILERHKAYREKNKEQILERLKINNKKYTCCCGSNILIYGKISHEKTKKHIEFMKSQSI